MLIIVKYYKYYKIIAKYYTPCKYYIKNINI